MQQKPPELGSLSLPVRSWAQTPVDAFILAKLEAKGIAPAPPADPRTLLRRLYFDLVGLPPTPAEVAAFLADYRASGENRRSAIEKVVDRLLSSPHFGERWGRHWLDLVRYAETLGHEFDYANVNAWRYRDYVIKVLLNGMTGPIGGKNRLQFAEGFVAPRHFL